MTRHLATVACRLEQAADRWATTAPRALTLAAVLLATAWAAVIGAGWALWATAAALIGVILK